MSNNLGLAKASVSLHSAQLPQVQLQEEQLGKSKDSNNIPLTLFDTFKL